MRIFKEHEDFLRGLPQGKQKTFRLLSRDMNALLKETHRIAQKTLDTHLAAQDLPPRILTPQEKGLLDIVYIAAIYNPQIMETEIVQCEYMPGLEDYRDRFIVNFQQLINDQVSNNRAFRGLSIREFDDMLRLALAYHLQKNMGSLSLLQNMSYIHFNIPSDVSAEVVEVKPDQKKKIVGAVQDFTDKLVDRTEYNISHGAQYRALHLAQRRAAKTFKASVISSAVAGVGCGVAAGIGANVLVGALTLGIGLVISLSVSALIYGYCRWKKSHMDDRKHQALEQSLEEDILSEIQVGLEESSGKETSWAIEQRESEYCAAESNKALTVLQASLFKAGSQDEMVPGLDPTKFPEKSLDESHTDSGLFALQGFSSVATLMMASA